MKFKKNRRLHFNSKNNEEKYHKYGTLAAIKWMQNYKNFERKLRSAQSRYANKYSSGNINHAIMRVDFLKRYDRHLPNYLERKQKQISQEGFISELIKKGLNNHEQSISSKLKIKNMNAVANKRNTIRNLLKKPVAVKTRIIPPPTNPFTGKENGNTQVFTYANPKFNNKTFANLPILLQNRILKEAGINIKSYPYSQTSVGVYKKHNGKWVKKGTRPMRPENLNRRI